MEFDLNTFDLKETSGKTLLDFLVELKITFTFDCFNECFLKVEKGDQTTQIDLYRELGLSK